MLNLFKRNKAEYTIDGIKFQAHWSYDDDNEGPQTAIDLLSLPTVANAVDIIADDIAQIPLYLLMRTENGRERLRNQLAYRLHQQPNTYQNGYRFWKTAAMQMLLAEAFILSRGGQFTLLPYGLTYSYETLQEDVRPWL